MIKRGDPVQVRNPLTQEVYKAIVVATPEEHHIHVVAIAIPELNLRYAFTDVGDTRCIPDGCVHLNSLGYFWEVLT